MSKDRDIDDILESLNQLLREGESHNDDHVESNESSAEVRKALDDLQDDLLDAVVNKPSNAEAADSDDVEAVDRVEVSDEANSEDISEPNPEAEAVEAWQQDEPDEDDAENDPVSDDADEPLNMHRVVLTEDMLVDNPQRSLLSLVGNKTDDRDAEKAVETMAPQTEAVIDHALMAELLDRVTDDVIRQLPILIKTSLEQHLNEALRGGQSSDSTDQTEE